MAKKLPKNSKKLSRVDSLINAKLEKFREEIKGSLISAQSTMIEHFGKQFQLLNDHIEYQLIPNSDSGLYQRLIYKLEKLLDEEKNVV